MNTTSQNYIPKEGVISTQPSLTVPDQSLTLRELLINYTRGNDLPTTQKQPAFFDSEQFIPDLNRMDLVDIQEMMEDNAQNAAQLQDNLKELSKPKKTVIHKKQNDSTEGVDD